MIVGGFLDQILSLNIQEATTNAGWFLALANGSLSPQSKPDLQVLTISIMVAVRNAVDAKAAKMEKKLKMVELQLKKRKLDQESGAEEPIEAEGSIIFDRNELLKRIANSDK